MLGTRVFCICGCFFFLTIFSLFNSPNSTVFAQESEADTTESGTAAERYFGIMSKATFHATKTETLPEGEPQEVPDDLKFEREWQTGMKCGPVALYFLLQLHGNQDVTLDEILEEVPVTEEKGSNLQTLKTTAAKYGLACQIVRVTPETLGDLPYGSIVHWETNNSSSLREDHFDVYLRMITGNGQHHIIDTSSCVTKYVPHSVASQMSSGYAMIPAGNSLSRWSGFAMWGLLGVIFLGNFLLGSGLMKP